jgi:hypothetical protein
MKTYTIRCSDGSEFTLSEKELRGLRLEIMAAAKTRRNGTRISYEPGRYVQVNASRLAGRRKRTFALTLHDIQSRSAVTLEHLTRGDLLLLKDVIYVHLKFGEWQAIRCESERTICIGRAGTEEDEEVREWMAEAEVIEDEISAFGALKEG